MNERKSLLIIYTKSCVRFLNSRNNSNNSVTTIYIMQSWWKPFVANGKVAENKKRWRWRRRRSKNTQNKVHIERKKRQQQQKLPRGKKGLGIHFYFSDSLNWSKHVTIISRKMFSCFLCLCFRIYATRKKKNTIAPTEMQSFGKGIKIICINNKYTSSTMKNVKTSWLQSVGSQILLFYIFAFKLSAQDGGNGMGVRIWIVALFKSDFIWIFN